MTPKSPVLRKTKKCPVLKSPVLKSPVLKGRGAIRKSARGEAPAVVRRQTGSSYPTTPWDKSVDPLPPDPQNSPEYWIDIWKGDRNEQGRLSGRYMNCDYYDNFCAAVDNGSWQGYTHAQEWFKKAFPILESNGWALNMLQNFYRKLFEEDSGDKHVCVIWYLIYNELSVRRLNEKLRDERYKEHDLYNSWKNLIPKIERTIQSLMGENWALLHPEYRKNLTECVRYADGIKKGDGVDMAKKKGKKKVAGKKKATSKSPAKGRGKESWGESILAVGRNKKGAVPFSWIYDRTIQRRIDKGYLPKGYNVRVGLTTKLKALAEAGDITIVGRGEYSFDGSKKSQKVVVTKKKPAKKAVKKVVKKSPAKKVKKVAKKKKSPKRPKK